MNIKYLKVGDEPTCESCVFYRWVGYCQCMLKPFEVDGDAFFVSPEKDDYCGQGYWHIEGYHMPVPYILACHILEEIEDDKLNVRLKVSDVKLWKWFEEVE